MLCGPVSHASSLVRLAGRERRYVTERWRSLTPTGSGPAERVEGRESDFESAPDRGGPWVLAVVRRASARRARRACSWWVEVPRNGRTSPGEPEDQERIDLRCWETDPGSTDSQEEESHEVGEARREVTLGDAGPTDEREVGASRRKASS